MKSHFRSGISTFQIILLLIVGYFVWDYVEENYIYTDTPKYVVQFKEAIHDFTQQKDTVKDVYKEAVQAQGEAKKVNYVFNNEKTKQFVQKWKKAEHEVNTLREKFETYQEETENFVDQLDDNLDKIQNDNQLKTKMQKYSEEKALKMAENIVKISQNIERLESSIQKGNNLIVALETVSSFNQLSQDVKEFDIVLDSSRKIFKDIDALVKEGEMVLDKELQY
jgi:ferritin-like metal-binding protein YciE